MSAALQCPKCLQPMRSIERSGVVIERCTECGGVFLDRGELEHLAAAELSYDTRATPQRSQPQSAPPTTYRRDDDGDDDDDDRYRIDPRTGKPRKKKRGFLSDIFDID